MIKRNLQRLAHRLGYHISKADEYYHLPKADVTYHHDLLYTFHNCDFMQDPAFMKAYKLGRDTDVHQSMLTGGYEIYWRIHVLCWAASHAMKLDGDFVECGVNTGIFARAILDYTKVDQSGKKYYLLDTFKGLDPQYSTERELDRSNKNYLSNKDTLYEQVCRTFKDFNVEIVQGAVPDTLPRVTSNRVAFLSIDMNCVQPEVEALNYFWDKMTPGGIIVLDDYGFANMYNEQKRAHDNFARSKGVEVLTLPTCQGMILKPSTSNEKRAA